MKKEDLICQYCIYRNVVKSLDDDEDVFCAKNAPFQIPESFGSANLAEIIKYAIKGKFLEEYPLRNDDVGGELAQWKGEFSYRWLYGCGEGKWIIQKIKEGPRIINWEGFYSSKCYTNGFDT